MPAMSRRVRITLLLLLVLCLAVATIAYGANYISSRRQVTPDSTQASSTPVSPWTVVQTIPNGMHGSLETVDRRLVAVTSENSVEFRNKQNFMSVMTAGGQWSSPKSLGNAGDFRGGVVSWENQVAIGQYPQSGIFSYDLNGNNIPTKSNVELWGLETIWTTAEVGATYKPAVGGERLYYVKNLLNQASDPAESSFIAMYTNWDGVGKTGVTGYHISTLNKREHPYYWGAMEIVGNRLFAAEHQWLKGGSLYELGPIPEDWAGSEKKLTEKKISGLPNAHITSIKASQDKTKIYVTAYDMSRGGNNYEGMVYTINLATNTLEGQIVKFPVPSAPSSVAQLNNKLYISVGFFNDVSTRNTGVVECTLTSSGGVQGCDQIYRPENIKTVTDVEVYNGNVYIIGQEEQTSKGVIYRLGALSSTTPSPTSIVGTATPQPTATVTTTIRPSVTATATATSTTRPTTQATTNPTGQVGVTNSGSTTIPTSTNLPDSGVSTSLKLSIVGGALVTISSYIVFKRRKKSFEETLLKKSK
jgi:LPXTG-motif cell wall-anchored protein